MDFTEQSKLHSAAQEVGYIGTGAGRRGGAAACLLFQAAEIETGA